jgi:hypothetical protein
MRRDSGTPIGLGMNAVISSVTIAVATIVALHVANPSPLVAQQLTPQQMQLLMQNPGLVNQYIARSGLTPEQIRQRLEVAGYSRTTLDAFLEAEPGEAGRETTRCTYTQLMTCGPQGCTTEQDSSDAFLLVPVSLSALTAQDAGTSAAIQRCNNAGCTEVTVVGIPGGAFVNVISPGYLLTIQATDVFGEGKGDFVEVATMMLAAIIRHGSCRGIQD